MESCEVKKITSRGVIGLPKLRMMPDHFFMRGPGFSNEAGWPFTGNRGTFPLLLRLMAMTLTILGLRDA